MMNENAMFTPKRQILDKISNYNGRLQHKLKRKKRDAQSIDILETHTQQLLKKVPITLSCHSTDTKKVVVLTNKHQKLMVLSFKNLSKIGAFKNCHFSSKNFSQIQNKAKRNGGSK